MEVAELDTQSTEVYPTPGMQLKTAREKLGLSINDVAKQSYISTAKLEDLENDLYEKLPSPIFIQGYLRKVAPLLKLNGDDLVASYNDYLRQMQSTVDQVMQPAEELLPVRSQRIPPKLIASSVLTGIALVVLVSVYVIIDGEEVEKPARQTSALIDIDNALEASGGPADANNELSVDDVDSSTAELPMVV